MIEDMIRPYYIDLEMSDLSEVTVRDYISGISSFLSYLDEAKITPKFENVSEAVVAQYLRHLHNKGNSNATIVKEAKWLKYFFAYCVQKGVIASNPVKKRMFPKVIHITPECLTEDEIRAILEATDRATGSHRTRDKVLILLLQNTVIRPSEAVNLNWGDIDFKRNVIRIMPRKTPGIKVIPMNDELKKALLSHHKASLQEGQEALLVGNDGQRLKRVSVDSIIRETARKAGIDKKVNWFTLRRASIWQMMKNGAYPHVAQELPINKYNTFKATAFNNLKEKQEV
jgi:integrase/recombinase XerD